MHIINPRILAFLALCGTALSYPNVLSHFQQKGSFRLDAVRQQRKARDSTQSLLPRAQGTLPNRPQPQPATTFFWLIQIEVGTPPQPINMTLDTGSGALWLRGGHNPPQSEVNQYHTIYDMTLSKTFVNTSTPFNAGIAYITGYWCTDTVAFAGMTIDKAPIGVAPPVQTDSDADAIMGMSPSHPDGTPAGSSPPWTATLVKSLDQPVMVANLRDNAKGTYDFGFIDHKLLAGPIQWNKINNINSAWELYDLWFSIDGKPTDASGGLHTVLDTDGVTISLDADIVKAYYATIPGSNDTSTAKDGSSWSVPCDTKMPDLQFSVGKGAPNSGVIKGIHLINEGQVQEATQATQLVTATPAPASNGTPIIGFSSGHPIYGSVGTNSASAINSEAAAQPSAPAQVNTNSKRQSTAPHCQAYVHTGKGNNFGSPFWQSNLVALWFPEPPAAPYVGLALQAPPDGNPSAPASWTNVDKLPGQGA